MEISKARLTEYHRTIERFAALAESEANAVLADLWLSNADGRPEILASIVRTIIPEIANQYGLAAATVSADLWEEIYEADTGRSMRAEIPKAGADLAAASISDTFGDKAIARAIWRASSPATGDNYGIAPSELAKGYVAQLVAGNVFNRAREIQTYNTRNVVLRRLPGCDHARFARIPTGDEACAFCITLASRGFVYHSAESAGEFDKYHNDCKCEVISSFSENPIIEGYSPDEYYNMYSNAVVRPGGENMPIDFKQTLANMRSMYGFK